MAPNIGSMALCNGLTGSIEGEWVALLHRNNHNLLRLSLSDDDTAALVNDTVDFPICFYSRPPLFQSQKKW